MFFIFCINSFVALSLSFFSVSDFLSLFCLTSSASPFLRNPLSLFLLIYVWTIERERERKTVSVNRTILMVFNTRLKLQSLAGFQTSLPTESQYRPLSSTLSKSTSYVRNYVIFRIDSPAGMMGGVPLPIRPTKLTLEIVDIKNFSAGMCCLNYNGER